MKAMVFAAGLGTRLRPLTDTVPKALVKVGGVPMLQHVILNLKRNGFDDIVVNVHHFAGKVKNFLRENDDFGVKITVSDESDCLLDTGGGIVKAAQYLEGDQPFLIHNVDILTDLDLNAMYKECISSGADATLLTALRDTSRYLLLDAEGLMKGWINVTTGQVKPPGLEASLYDHFAFGGIHVMSQSALKALCEYSDGNPFSVTTFYIDKCREIAIKGYVDNSGYSWFDIGRHATLEAAEKWLTGK